MKIQAFSKSHFLFCLKALCTLFFNSAGLLVINIFRFHMSEMSSFHFLFLKDIFAGYRILNGQDFFLPSFLFFSTLKMVLHCLLFALFPVRNLVFLCLSKVYEQFGFDVPWCKAFFLHVFCVWGSLSS